MQLAQNDHSNIFWDDPSCVKLTCNNVWQRTLAQPPACIENKTTIYSIHALFVSIYIHTDNISPKQTFAYGYFICFLIYLLRILLQVFSSNMKISYVDDSHLLEVLCIWLFSLIWLSGFPLKYILLSLDKFARGMYIVNRFSIAYFRTRTLFVTIESSKKYLKKRGLFI